MSTTAPKYTTIDGVTYDITDFLQRHPGGEDLLMLAVDRDATVLFHSYHRNVDNAKTVLSKLKVVSGTLKPNRIETPLYQTIKKRVNKYFEDKKMISRGNWFMWGKSLTLFLLTMVIYYFSMVLGYWGLCPILGVLMAMNGLAIQHDANHGSFSKYQNLNRLAAFVDDLIGGSSLIWKHQHDIIHHAYPNHHELDGDSYSKFPIMRLNPKLPLTWYIRFQWLYGPFFLYSLLGISYSFEDCTTFLQGKYLFAQFQPLRLLDKITFWTGKIFHFSIFLILPLYIHGLSAIWMLYLPMQFIGSNFLATVFAVSHNTLDTAYNISENSDWAELQIRTSANWSVNSTAWWLVSGGLNFQIEHHLFPGVCHIHYPAISKIVQQVCKEYNLPYNAYPTFFDIYVDHLKTLKKLGTWKE